MFIPESERPEEPRPMSARIMRPIIQLEENKKSDFKIEETFQMKLRKNKIKKTMGPKKSIDDTNPEEIKLQKAMESLYSQVKKKLPQLQKTTQMLDLLAKNIIDNPNDPKVRSVRLQNKGFAENILKYKAALTILEFYGFMRGRNENNEEIYFFPDTTGITSLKGKRLQASK